jgi:hypothetical protein
MYRLMVAIGLTLCWCGTVGAQDIPRVEVYGGYSYANVDTNNLAPRQSANGWEAAVSGNLNRWFALEADASGYYKTYLIDLSLIDLGTVNVHVRDYAFGAGPRVNFRPFFAHALIGVDHLSGHGAGLSASQNSFAGAFGGGVQWPPRGRWAIRASADYVLTQHNIFGGSAYNQNNYRVSGGLVFALGRIAVAEPHQARAPAQTFHECVGTSDVAVLGVSGCANENGFLVQEIQSHSPAAAAGINRGDVITQVNGRSVRSSRDIESAIANSSSGVISVSYMIRGTWVAEREIRLH